MLSQRQVVATPVAATPSQQNQAATTAASADVPLLVSETVKGSTYFYSGVYQQKSACNSFGSGIRYSAADGGHVTILLITEPLGTSCAQAAGTGSGEPFNVSIKLAGAAPHFDGVQLNGAAIPAQLVEAN